MDGDTSSLLEAARWLRDARGFSVIPLDHPDAPIASESDQVGKRPTAPWKLFQEAHATDDNLRTWFGNGTPRNLGIVTGQISGVVVVDTDSPEAEAWATAHLPVTPAPGHRHSCVPCCSTPWKVGPRRAVPDSRAYSRSQESLPLVRPPPDRLRPFISCTTGGGGGRAR